MSSHVPPANPHPIRGMCTVVVAPKASARWATFWRPLRMASYRMGGIFLLIFLLLLLWLLFDRIPRCPMIFATQRLSSTCTCWTAPSANLPLVILLVLPLLLFLVLDTLLLVGGWFFRRVAEFTCWDCEYHSRYACSGAFHRRDTAMTNPLPQRPISLHTWTIIILALLLLLGADECVVVVTMGAEASPFTYWILTVLLLVDGGTILAAFDFTAFVDAVDMVLRDNVCPWLWKHLSHLSAHRETEVAFLVARDRPWYTVRMMWRSLWFVVDIFLKSETGTIAFLKVRLESFVFLKSETGKISVS